MFACPVGAGGGAGCAGALLLRREPSRATPRKALVSGSPPIQIVRKRRGVALKLLSPVCLPGDGSSCVEDAVALAEALRPDFLPTNVMEALSPQP